ncbi:MAG TPA: hypothetical protein VFA78_04835 [Chloroflexota bacterium]|nr:hypothetical protein [Chloroflexota bacterium]
MSVKTLYQWPVRHWPAISAVGAGVAALALAALYWGLIGGQGVGDLTSPRVHFIFGFTAALGVACLLGAVFPSVAARIAVLSAAAGGFATMIIIGIFSIGLLYVIPTLLATVALVHTFPDDADRFAFLSGTAGFLAAVTTMGIGLSEFPI